jgi:hypothetical protein
MKEHIRLEAVVPSELHGKRVDLAAAALWPAYSRGKLSKRLRLALSSLLIQNSRR